MLRASNKLLIIIVVTWALFAVQAGEAERLKHPGADDSAPIIRQIAVQVRDVFDEPNLGFLYKTANTLKINTKESVIRRELLFKPGDRIDYFVIDETLRNLRRLAFIRDPQIVPYVEGDYVDILVSVQDTWTLFPQISFSTGSGSDKSSIGITEKNLRYPLHGKYP